MKTASTENPSPPSRPSPRRIQQTLQPPADSRVSTSASPGDPLETARPVRKWQLVVGPRALNATMLLAIARMASHGPVRVLDGGNRFNAYTVARAIGGQPQVLNRVTVSRAFTCYQVLSLLESTPAIQVVSAAGRSEPLRLVALDLFNTFYDEAVQAGERKRLLRACIIHLERLAENGGAISVHPPALPSPTAVELLEILRASRVVEPFFVQAALPPPEPLKLF